MTNLGLDEQRERRKQRKLQLARENRGKDKRPYAAGDERFARRLEQGFKLMRRSGAIE
jgi:hypothetical protein